MKRFLPLLLLAACGRAFTLAGPAPPGALRCALAHAEAAGYQLIEGGVAARSLVLAQSVGPVADDRLVPAETDPARARRAPDPPSENRLIVRVEEDELRLVVTGITEAGEEVAPAASADAHARTILAMCTSSPPVLPDGTPIESAR